MSKEDIQDEKEEEEGNRGIEEKKDNQSKGINFLFLRPKGQNIIFWKNFMNIFEKPKLDKLAEHLNISFRINFGKKKIIIRLFKRLLI